MVHLYYFTHFTFNNFFFEKSCRFWDNADNIVQPDRLQIIWRMRIASGIAKARITHWDYVKRIALPHQQWLHERAVILRYTYIDNLMGTTATRARRKGNNNDKEGSTKIFCSQQTALLVETSQSKQVSRCTADGRERNHSSLQSGNLGTWISLITILQDLVTDLNERRAWACGDPVTSHPIFVYPFHLSVATIATLVTSHVPAVQTDGT